MSSGLKLGFLGAGKMATALARGILKAGSLTPDDLMASDPYDAARAAIAKEAGIRSTASNLDVLKFAQVLFLAVKPEQVAKIRKAEEARSLSWTPDELKATPDAD